MDFSRCGWGKGRPGRGKLVIRFPDFPSGSGNLTRQLVHTNMGRGLHRRKQLVILETERDLFTFAGEEEMLGDRVRCLELRVGPPMLEIGLNCDLVFERSQESWETQEGRTEVAALVLRCAGCKKSM